MKVKHKKTAFTLAEALLTLAILGVIVAFATPVLVNIIPAFNGYRIKKINSTLKSTVNEMLNYDDRYEGKHDFSNTGLSYLGGVKVANVEAFRNVFKKYISVNNSFKCQAYRTKTTTVETICYMAADGSVWAIPDTDFVSTDNGSVVIELDNKIGGGRSLYAPITIYPEYKKGVSARNNAIIYGVRRDGKVMLIEEGFACENADKNTMQCFAKREIASTRMKKR